MRSSAGDGLLPRHVSVWLPPGYALPENASRRYPVLYMHDGQNAFDPATAFLGREWHADEVATEAIRRGAMPPVIIVGIWNTPERVSDYTPDQDLEEKRGDNKPQGRGGKGERYLRWIVEELKPFIDSNYRTQPGRETTAIMGSSLGGIISLAAAERNPEVFGCVAAVSPSLWWNKGSVIERWQKRTPDVCRLWVDMGDRERAGLTDALKRFEAAAQPTCRSRLHAEIVPGGRHDEPSWSARLGRILMYLFAESDWQRVQPPEPVPPPQEAPKAEPPPPDATGAAGAGPAPKSPPA
jgi:predicted alpha/beta superfamily hydrolase